MRAIFLSLFFSILITSCASETSSGNSMPDWYFNPQINSTYNLYGTGYGDSLESAKSSALSDLTQKIVVDVSATMALNRQEASVNGNSIFESDSRQNIQTETKRISLPNYELVKSEQKGNFVYALVQVRKSDVISLYEKELKDAIEIVRITAEHAKQQDLLAQKQTQLQIREIAAESYNPIMVIETLQKNNQIANEAKALFLKMREEDLKINQKLSFYLQYTKEDEALASSISEGLAAENVSISKDKNLKQAKIILKAKNTEQQVYGTYLVKSNLTLYSYNYAGNLVATSNIALSANSNISYTSAKQLIAQNLTKKIGQEGVFTILNLNQK